MLFLKENEVIFLLNKRIYLGMVAHAFNLSSWEAEAGNSTLSSRTARAKQRNLILKEKKV